MVRCAYLSRNCAPQVAHWPWDKAIWRRARHIRWSLRVCTPADVHGTRLWHGPWCVGAGREKIETTVSDMQKSNLRRANPRRQERARAAQTVNSTCPPSYLSSPSPCHSCRSSCTSGCTTPAAPTPASLSAPLPLSRSSLPAPSSTSRSDPRAPRQSRLLSTGHAKAGHRGRRGACCGTRRYNYPADRREVE